VAQTESASAVSTQQEATDEKVSLAPSLWLDPDVRWLTGVHEAEGHAYLVREPYEELLWWLLMPSLLRLAGETVPNRAAVDKMSRTVEGALATAEAAHYRIGAMLRAVTGPATDKEHVEKVDSPFAKPKSVKKKSTQKASSKPPAKKQKAGAVKKAAKKSPAKKQKLDAAQATTEKPTEKKQKAGAVKKAASKPPAKKRKARVAKSESASDGPEMGDL
jgi:hypothetical protein